MRSTCIGKRTYLTLLLNFVTRTMYDVCSDVDQYWADELTSEQLFSQYIARNAPVLIRGLIHDWEAINAYSANQLMKSHGKMRVTVSIEYLNNHFFR